MKKITFLLFLLGGVYFNNMAFAATPSNLPIMNKASLAKYDGKNGHKAYVALDNLVYDVTNVPEWKGGSHYKGMVAGTDLTPNIQYSPHGPSIVRSLKLKPIATYSDK